MSGLVLVLAAIAQTASASTVAPSGGHELRLSRDEPATVERRDPLIVLSRGAVAQTAPCDTGLHRVGDRYQQGPSLDDGKVRIYRLMTLQAENGCPIPVILGDAPGGDNAIGRVIGEQPRNHPDRRPGFRQLRRP